MKLWLMPIVLMFAGFSATNCAGELVGFYFSGYVYYVASGEDPFGGGFQQLTPVSGHALYDTESPASYSRNDCACTGYLQSINDGFSATFGTEGTDRSMTFQASSYIIEVQNLHDHDKNSWIGDTDQLAVIFSAALYPPINAPLYANGVPYQNSLLEVLLAGASDTFPGDDSSLPTSLDLTKFNSEYNFLDERYTRLGLLWRNISLLAYTGSDGDYDKSGSVDNDDYTLWRSNFGSTTALDADGNGDGIVDAADYIVWRQHKGQLAASGSVPEPTGALLVVSCLGVIAIYRSRMD